MAALLNPRVLAVAAAGAGALVAGKYYLSGSNQAGAAAGMQGGDNVLSTSCTFYI